jgi:hypothetical protein
MIGLREVLSAFESGQAKSITQMSLQFDINPALLESMLEFWVRKGRLRHSAYSGCAECGANHSCPILVALPRRYELVTSQPAACRHTIPCCSSSD